jgi:hypothetical protein
MSQNNHPTYIRDIISNKVLGRNVYYHLYANEEISTNSPESMHEAITVIEIICNKPMMHMDTCLKIFEHTLDILNEFCTFLLLLFQWQFPPEISCSYHFLLSPISTLQSDKGLKGFQLGLVFKIFHISVSSSLVKEEINNVHTNFLLYIHWILVVFICSIPNY